MKTLTKSLFSVALTLVVLSSSTLSGFAATPSKVVTTISTEGKSFNKIWVSGNVKIVLTQGDKESISGTENFNAEKTSVMSKGQTLYINSMESSQVTIAITVKDLQRIEAYGQSVVVTSNDFDVKYLQLFLNQSATAKISAKTQSLYTVLNDDAKLKISGSTDQHTLIAGNMRNLKFNNFASLKSEQYASVQVMDAERLLAAVAK